MAMASGAWACRVGAVGAVLATAFARRGTPAPTNPYLPGGEARSGPTAADVAAVRKDIADATFAEGLKQIARKAAARRANGVSG
jgi:hypothetical protein